MQYKRGLIENYIDPELISRDPKAAFQSAIDSKVLSNQKSWENFAGHYMYMYSDDQKDYFKHINTRAYIWNVYKEPA